MPAYRWVILVFGILAYATSHFARQNYTGIQRFMQADFDLDRGALGLLGAAFFYAYALCQMPWGIAADKLGSRLAAAAAYVSVSGGVARWFPPHERGFSQSAFGGVGGALGEGAAYFLLPVLAISFASGWRQATNTPPSAGPTTAAVWNMMVFRAMAFGRCSRGTSVGTSACRAGKSKAPTAAPSAANK